MFSPRPSKQKSEAVLGRDLRAIGSLMRVAQDEEEMLALLRRAMDLTSELFSTESKAVSRSRWFMSRNAPHSSESPEAAPIGGVISHLREAMPRLIEVVDRLSGPENLPAKHELKQLRGSELKSLSCSQALTRLKHRQQLAKDRASRLSFLVEGVQELHAGADAAFESLHGSDPSSSLIARAQGLVDAIQGLYTAVAYVCFKNHDTVTGLADVTYPWMGDARQYLALTVEREATKYEGLSSKKWREILSDRVRNLDEVIIGPTIALTLSQDDQIKHHRMAMQSFREFFHDLSGSVELIIREVDKLDEKREGQRDIVSNILLTQQAYSVFAVSRDALLIFGAEYLQELKEHLRRERGETSPASERCEVLRELETTIPSIANAFSELSLVAMVLQHTARERIYRSIPDSGLDS